MLNFIYIKHATGMIFCSQHALGIGYHCLKVSLKNEQQFLTYYVLNKPYLFYWRRPHWMPHLRTVFLLPRLSYPFSRPYSFVGVTKCGC